MIIVIFQILSSFEFIQKNYDKDEYNHKINKI